MERTMKAVTPVDDKGIACAERGEGGGQFRTIMRLLARVVLWPVRVAKARRSFAALTQMTDHELKDIGLTRQDLWNAAAVPLDQDPTRYLARAAAEFSHQRRGLGR
jgi:uncharacterized protein YjiS (DUF1127 family)